MMPERNELNLHDVIKNSYSKSKAKNMNGYMLDSQLSNDNQQVYFNPKEKKLLYSVTGTHNLADVGTDLYLAGGKLKDTNRYKSAKTTLEQSKKKYGVSNATITGYSLGGSIAGYIGGNGDSVFTLDKGATAFQPVRKGENAYRTEGDLVSLLNRNSKNMTTLINPNEPTGKFIKDALNAHNVDNLNSIKSISLI
jgi:hypothetical protein